MTVRSIFPFPQVVAAILTVLRNTWSDCWKQWLWKTQPTCWEARDTVKDIHSRHLEYHYAPPSLDGVDCIGIDEFAVREGHIYKTIVVDLRSGRILHVGEGKGADALKGFWKRIKRKIKYVAKDLSAAFISSVYEHCPNAVHVFDHFHVVKLMNEKLDDIRRVQYKAESTQRYEIPPVEQWWGHLRQGI